MITIRVKPYHRDDKVQTGAVWEIYDDASLSNLVSREVGNSTNGFINYVVFNLALTNDRKFYRRFKRLFDDEVFNPGETTGWSELKAFHVKADNSKLDAPDIKIDMPYLFKEETDDEIIFKISKIRTNNNYPLIAVNWLVEDGVGNTKFKSIKDEVNLHSITLNKHDINYDNLNTLVVRASHQTILNKASDFAMLTHNIKELKYEIKGNMTSMSPDREHKFILTTDDNLKFVSAYLTIDEQRISITVEDNVLTIPADVLKSNSKYTLSAFIRDKDTEKEETTNFFLTTSNLRQPFFIDESFIYQKELKQVSVNKTSRTSELISVSTESLDGDILLEDMLDKVIVGKFDKLNNMFIYNDLSPLSNSIASRKGTISLFTNTGSLITISDTNSNSLVINKYSYNPNLNNKLTFVNSVSVNDLNAEQVLKSNSVDLSLDKNSLYVLGKDKNSVTYKLKEIDLDNMTIVDLADRPGDGLNSVSLTTLPNGTLISMFGANDKYERYTYNVIDDSWDVGAFDILNNNGILNIKNTFLGKDGKILLLPEYDKNVSKLGIYDVDNNKVEMLMFPFLPTDILVKGVIRLNTGEIIITALTNGDDKNKMVFKYQ